MQKFISKTKIVSLFIAMAMICTLLPIWTESVSAADAPSSLANTLVSTLTNNNDTVTDVKIIGDEEQFGTFTGKDFLPFSDGIIMSTGKVSSIFQDKGSTSISGEFDRPGDDTLTKMYQSSGFTGVTHDAAVLEFMINPKSNKLEFQYVFASTEYDEEEEYNDLFSLEVDGVNVAKLPDNKAVSIATTKDTEYVIDNPDGKNIAFSGYTIELTCNADVVKNTPVKIRLAIADSGDDSMDSAVFVKAGSVRTEEYSVTFNSNGGSSVTSLANIFSGSKITAPTAPTKTGYTFGGWYKDAACTSEWNFDTDTVTANTTLFAKWIANTPETKTVDIMAYLYDSNGKVVPNATIEIQPDSKITKTDDKGYFEFKNIPVGDHTVYVKDTDGKTLSNILVKVTEDEKILLDGQAFHSDLKLQIQLNTDGKIHILKESPKTGDNTSIMPTALVAILSLCVVLTLIKKRKIVK